MTNLAAWDRALRANQGKPVQVTILRDKKQQTLTLQVDSKHRGALQLEEIFPAKIGRRWRSSTRMQLEQLKQQMDELRKNIYAGRVQDRSATDGRVPAADGAVEAADGREDGAAARELRLRSGFFEYLRALPGFRLAPLLFLRVGRPAGIAGIGGMMRL